jgi:CRISPR/Cas system endoribonuclease Cas6 (RAMP superfamily)
VHSAPTYKRTGMTMFLNPPPERILKSGHHFPNLWNAVAAM